MYANAQFPADLLTFAKEILNENFFFSCSDKNKCIHLQCKNGHK